MKSKITKLRARLAEVFAAASAKAEHKAALEAGNYCEMDKRTREAFGAAWSESTSILRRLLEAKEKGTAVQPEANDYYDNLSIALGWRHFCVWDNWTVRPDVTGDEIAAAEKDILAGKLSALELFRLQGERMYFDRALSADAQDQCTFFVNLQYLCLALATYAKHLNSFAAARCFLLNASRLKTVSEMACPNLTEERAAAFIDNLQTGFEELAIAADYSQLDADWESYRKQEYANVFGSAAK